LHVQHTTLEQSTEEKIRKSAEKEFMEKGFAGARIRDIAANAGINLALLNYYFRSKEKLYEQIMAQKIDKLFALILPTLNDKTTSLLHKLHLIAEHYANMLTHEPNLPGFVLSEMQNNPRGFAAQIKLKSNIMQSDYIRQLKAADPKTQPIHHLITYLGILLFPFLMRPVLLASGSIDQEQFKQQVLERQKSAPLWMASLLGLREKHTK
jgi:AcrR family transcriptional regulator